MALAVQTTATSAVSTASTSHTVSLPSSIAAGDLLVITFGWTENLPQTITWPAGYTPITGAKVEQSTVVGLDAAYRQADGTEGSTITVTTSANTKSTHNSYRITGHENPATQAPEAAPTSGISTGAADPPNLAPTGGSKDYLWLAVANSDGETDHSAAPTNYTDLLTASTGIVGAGSTNCRMGSARRALTAASEDPGAFATTSTNWTAMTIAIHPAAAGTTVSPAVISVTASLPTPGVLAASTVAPATVAAIAALPTPTILAAATVTPAVIPVIVALPTPTIVVEGATTVTPATISVLAALPEATILAAATVTPAGIVISVTVPTPDISAGVLVLPATIGLIVALPTPTVLAASTVNPATIAALIGVPTPVILAASLVTPSTIAVVVALPTPLIIVAVPTFWVVNAAGYTVNPAAYDPIEGPEDSPWD